MKEKIEPINLGHLQDKAMSIRHNLEVYRDNERSEEMREQHLKNAEWTIGVIIRDIDYLMDSKLFNGKRAMGLDKTL